jgi:hypothetical protein
MNKTYSKLAAIGILLCLLFFAWTLLARPYLALWDDRVAVAERLHKKQATLASLINNQQHLQQQLAAITNNKTLEDLYLDKKAGALADIKLQRIVKEHITQNGGTVLQATIKQPGKASPKESDDFKSGEKAVTISVLMRGSIKNIYSILQKLENSRPFIVVTDLQISQNQSRYQNANSGSASDYRARYEATAFIL